ncbi:MAG: DUF1232 domain-containing protein [Firmicutes bacterium]|nr:DUF1232 domain-containing protein [Bacillota bacterium]
MTDEAVKSALGESAKKAEDMFKDEEKTRGFLNEIENKLGDFPKLDKIMDDVKTVIAMLRDVLNKKYDALPVTAIASLLGALMYLLKGRDLIPDSIPVAGQLDDLAIMVLALKLCSGDIEKYKKWRAEQKDSGPNLQV